MPEKQEATHVITTDNPILVDLGLGSFSTGVLYEWVTKNNFNNLQHIGGWSAGATREETAWNAMTAILGDEDALDEVKANNVDGALYYQIETYRPEGRNSADYTYDYLFKNNADQTNQEPWNYSVNNRKYDGNDVNIEAYFVNGAYDNRTSTNIIRLNEAVLAGPGQLFSSDEEAARIFIRDIKNSYDGGVKWTNLVNIIVPGSNVGCDIPIEWTLSLRGKAPKKAHSVSILEPLITGDMKTPAGTVHTGMDRKDQNRRLPKTGDETQDKKAGKLAMHYNEYTGEFESGTPQILAVMKTDLAAATPPDGGVDGDPDAYDDKDTGFQVTHGQAAPLSMKNGNPYKWGPEWKYTSGCDEDEKQEVLCIPVQNKLPASFKKGDTVILNKIEGVWQPGVAFSGIAQPDTVDVGVGGWQFMSMMSNAVHYFNVPGTNTAVNPVDYEDAIWQKYYAELGPFGNNDKSAQLGHARHGYMQITSFDMMGEVIGGNRTFHALGNCNVDVKIFDQEWDRSKVELLPFSTSPFFGPIFPEGYQPVAKYAKYREGTDVTDQFVYGPRDNNVGPWMQTDIPAGSPILSPLPDFADNTDGNPLDSDSRLRQLPADIALNAHPDSTVGGPIPILDTIWGMFDAPAAGQPMRDVIAITLPNKLARYSWLADANDQNNPTFEFAPVNNTKITFRPLKSEVYSAFERNGPFGFQVTRDQDNEDVRGCFSSLIYNKASARSQEEPISVKMLQRVFNPGGTLGSNNQGIWGNYGLQHSYDLGNHPRRPGNYSTGNAFPFPYVRDTWMGLAQGVGGDDKSSGAVGVIGAQCTVTANTAINFNTTNNIGMRGWFVNASLGFSSSFGGRDSTYYSFCNTTLHARIFHQHPRHLTVYDPRFFAVHHFAPGIGEPAVRKKYLLADGIEAPCQDFDDQEIDCSVDSLLIKRTSEVVWQNDAAEPGYDPDNKRGTKWFHDILDYPETDFRVPTLNNGDRDAEGFPVGEGYLVIDTSDVPYDDTNQPEQWREFEHWKINSGFRGALLPATNSRITIGVADNSIIFEENGQEYSQNDVFTVTAGAGTGILLKPVIDQQNNNAIIGFEIQDRGRDYIPKDFFTQTQLNAGNNTYNRATLKIVPLTQESNGTGLKAYFVAGVTYLLEGETIERPLQATQSQIINLTPTPETPQENKYPITLELRESREQNVVLVNKSPNDQYDVFLHYHNDVSHVFGRDNWASTPPCFEQFVELDISPF